MNYFLIVTACFLQTHVTFSLWNSCNIFRLMFQKRDHKGNVDLTTHVKTSSFFISSYPGTGLYKRHKDSIPKLELWAPYSRLRKEGGGCDMGSHLLAKIRDFILRKGTLSKRKQEAGTNVCPYASFSPFPRDSAMTAFRYSLTTAYLMICFLFSL